LGITNIHDTIHGFDEKKKVIGTAYTIRGPQQTTVFDIFSSLQDACSKFATCHKTIKKYSATGDIYKGYIWKLT
jgi:hypothetical protein